MASDEAKKESELLLSFRAARRVSTPIVAISTPDPAATIDSIRSLLKKEDAVLVWDQVKGLRGVNDGGLAAMGVIGVDPRQTLNLVEGLVSMERLPAGSVVFLMNGHRFLDHVGVMQGVWNLRDLYKRDKRTLVLLGPMFKLPLELSNDVVMLDEPLPTRLELERVLDQQHKNAGLPPPEEPKRAQVLDAIVGLAAYTAESVVAMSLSSAHKGVDIDRCWDRKVKAIENTDGLRVWRGKENLDDLKGINQAVAFSRMLIKADAFGAIVFIDEMEKAIAGGLSDYTGDSGVSKDQIGALLSYIEDTQSMGVLYAGLAGCGKTQLAKATARASGKPLIVFDLGGMKGGTVGSSEAKIRAALKVVSATAEGRVLFLATANKTASFTPELNRRFPDQFFFDLLDDDGRASVWPVYGKKNGLTPAQLKFKPGFDRGWTGAEIKRVCERAALFNLTVPDAAKFLVPSAVSAKDTIQDLRRHATGRFLSAAYEGPYRMPSEDVAAVERGINLEE